jgi:hypothetical protein
VEADHRKAASFTQQAFGGRQSVRQFVELAVDVNAHRLEGPGGRILLVVRLVPQRFAHDAREFAGRLQRTRGHYGAGHAARLALFAVEVEHIGNGLFVGRVEEIGRALAILAHPHVERAVG